ncbi:MAG: hypothetical protein WBQ52_15345, partial [Terracidiphilus sp.]
AAAAPAAAAPTAPAATLMADEVVGKYVDAIGGKDAIAQIKSLSMVTSAQVMGNDVPGTVVLADGVGYKSAMEFNGTSIIQCYTAKGGWQVNPMAGAADPTAMSDDEYKVGKDQIYVGGPLYDYAAKGNKVELVPGDAGTYKIKLTTKDNTETTYVFDSKTFLIKSTVRKGQMQGQDVDITTAYSDYRKTDTGYLLPYEMDLDFGGQFQLSIAIKKVDVNQTIDPAIFEMPKPAPAQPAAPAAPATQPSA